MFKWGRIVARRLYIEEVEEAGADIDETVRHAVDCPGERRRPIGRLTRAGDTV
jgi:hypothetical protein